MPLFGPKVPPSPPSGMMPSVRQASAKFFERFRACFSFMESGMAPPPDPLHSGYEAASTQSLLDNNSQLSKAKLEMAAAADALLEARHLWPEGAPVHDELDKALRIFQDLIDNAIAMNSLWFESDDLDKVTPRLQPLLARNRRLGADGDVHFGKAIDLLARSTGIVPPE